MNENKVFEAKMVKQEAIVTIHPPVKTYPKQYVTKIETSRVKKNGKIYVEKNAVTWRVPSNDEEAKTFYGTTIDALVIEGVKKLSTMPAYAGDHAAMQKQADDYRVGVRASGTGVKEAKNVLELAKKKGLDLAAIREMIEKAMSNIAENVKEKDGVIEPEPENAEVVKPEPENVEPTHNNKKGNKK